jgi:hypothetical protein
MVEIKKLLICTLWKCYGEVLNCMCVLAFCDWEISAYPTNVKHHFQQGMQSYMINDKIQSKIRLLNQFIWHIN